MKKLLVLTFIFIAANCFAQDYYLAPAKNKTPLKVRTTADISKVLKLQDKDKKYRSIILFSDKKQAVYLLVPSSLNVRSDNKNSFIVSNYIQDDDNADEYKNFSINIFFKDSIKDMQQTINKLSQENGKEIPFEHITKNYGRTEFEQYTFSLNENKFIVLQAPYAGRYVEFIYMAHQPDGENAKPNNKGEAVLGIAASSLNKAVLTKSADISSYKIAGLDDAVVNSIIESGNPMGKPDPVMQNWVVNKVSARQTAYYFEIKDDEESLGYTFTLPSNVSPQPEGTNDVRIIIDKTENCEMWFELVYKNSEKYYNEASSKYLNGKKLGNKKQIKFKAGGKNINFVKRNALNANAYNYFFTVEGKKFVLSFIAPSEKMPYYEQISATFLKTFKSTATK